MSEKTYHNHRAILQRIVLESKSALNHNPSSIPDMGRMGDAFLQLHQYPQAINAYQKILNLDEKNISAILGLATVYVLMSDHDQAAKLAEKAIAIRPGELRALGIMAAVFERQRKVEDILQLLGPIVESGNKHPTLVLPYARALFQGGERDVAISLLEESLSHPANQGDNLISTHFLLGKINDKSSDFDKAFEYYKKANDLRYVYFDTSRPTIEQEYIRARFTSDFMSQPRWRSARVNRCQPVFIVGMPRSGTTLVDRIISSHPDAVSAGELITLPKIIETMCHTFGYENGHFTTCVDKLTNEQVSVLADQYLEVLQKERVNKLCITDKMPVNFMYIGMIQILFPNAKIINCIRNPADLCLSCYIQDFHGFKPYLNRLDEIAMVYRNYRVIMNHWKSVLSIQIHDVEYENIVASPDTEIKKLIDFISLPWDEKCLNFHKEGQFINTVSYDQVDKPIYNSSVNRWKHYEKHLDSLKTSLDEFWPAD